LTGGYDGVVRAFDYSQTQVAASVIHTGAITSLTFVPAQSSDQSHLLLTGSLDLTAKLSQITLSASAEAPSNISELASLHLHTAPISSVAAASSGQTLLTASWDGLIGVWDTSIPTHDEVADPNTQESKKKRKVVRESQAKRKAPIGVLKSHTARVSKVVFGNTNDAGNAYSCGMDSTIRVWDVENGLCTRTIVSKFVFRCSLGADFYLRRRQRSRCWTSL
jgi:ribosome biogenesis protein YTM1